MSDALKDGMRCGGEREMGEKEEKMEYLESGHCIV